MNNKYYKDYVEQPGANENEKQTQMKYTGDYYEYRLSIKEYKKMRSIMLGYLIIFSLIYVLIGFLNNSGSRCFYVLFPYITSFLPLTFLVRSFARIPSKRKKMEFAIYDKSYIRFKQSLAGMIATTLVTLLGDIIFIMRNGSNIDLSREAAFCIASGILAVLTILLLLYHNRIVCEKQTA